MPCSKCNGDFNLLNWKLKCFECEENYCSKCLTKFDGESYCETCETLVRRPPEKTKLMELKSKDLQQYLNKHNISTRGIVEKQELVDLFCKNPLPSKDKKRHKRFNCTLSGSVPNLAQRSQTYLNNLRSNAEAAFNSRNWQGGQSAQTTPVRSPTATSPQQTPSGNHFTTSASTTATFTTGTDSTTYSYRTNSHNGTHPTTSTGTTAGDTTTGSPPASAVPTAPPEQTESSPQIPKKYPKLTDFKTLDDMTDLSVKQLKELLSLNRVDYKGCVEKAELLERANRLWIDSNIRKEEVSGGETLGGKSDEACKICMDAPLDCVLLECGHMATCIDCGKRLAECPICRQYVTRVVRTFKA